MFCLNFFSQRSTILFTFILLALMHKKDFLLISYYNPKPKVFERAKENMTHHTRVRQIQKSVSYYLNDTYILLLFFLLLYSTHFCFLSPCSPSFLFYFSNFLLFSFSFLFFHSFFMTALTLYLEELWTPPPLHKNGWKNLTVSAFPLPSSSQQYFAAVMKLV